ASPCVSRVPSNATFARRSRFVYFRSSFFFFNDTATTEIYTLSLHDALPIWEGHFLIPIINLFVLHFPLVSPPRSEEHTSELQSHSDLVCRLLLENKKLQ